MEIDPAIGYLGIILVAGTGALAVASVVALIDKIRKEFHK